MKKMILISIVATLGCFLFGSDNIDPIDQYYDNLELNNVELAAYNHGAQSGDGGDEKGIYRKRAHKRKRIIRPPIQGK